MAAWMAAWLHGWLHGYMVGCMDGCMAACMDSTGAWAVQRVPQVCLRFLEHLQCVVMSITRNGYYHIRNKEVLLHMCVDLQCISRISITYV